MTTILDKLLLYSPRETEEQVNNFVDIVENLQGKVDCVVAHALMKTFSQAPDYGTQESVMSTLASGDPSVVTKAILEEIPRLVKEAPRWADTLMINQYLFNKEQVLSILKDCPMPIKNAVLKAINKPEVLSFEPKIKELIEYINDSKE
ncbi:hypothetical protein [Candidatus Odyssella thessalonicensis]|uniref:hypothetical protein n=1 Tax=Candidatus Odyssella thessalonicensis TaxID=84647 RepID=UPI000225B23D|nr:hypothetical protein [Candidatus Odyssella thessalonicensis]